MHVCIEIPLVLHVALKPILLISPGLTQDWPKYESLAGTVKAIQSLLEEPHGQSISFPCASLKHILRLSIS